MSVERAIALRTVAGPPYTTRPGSRFPPGATAAADGVNFCVFSRYATSAELLLFADAASTEPFQTIALMPEHNRSFFFWHVFVEGLAPGVCYTWRLDGPDDTAHSGRRFNPRKDLVDPWARAVTDRHWNRDRAGDPRDAGHASMRGIVTAPLPARRVTEARSLDDAVIYELHVGGFTRDPSSGVRSRGTFTGLIEKIPYLKDLGVTHVELQPVMAFDEQDLPREARARGLSNYWGYSTHSFHSPHPGYCVDPAEGHREFRALTDALHAAGIGVLLDVVFNHTAEGGTLGPMINFKGLANEVFYHLDAADKRRYRDYTGCGNTVNCNHPMATAFIVRCLEYWVEELGVDGFRFDLASVFARASDGAVMTDPPLPWAIEFSRALSAAPLIAEAWDAAGLYHVGAFPGMAWAEWNGRYRDVVRRYVRGDAGLLGELATRVGGSADLYAAGGRLPNNSINFVTCHDGFTLHDLVSYDVKHNEENGEDNRDGNGDNMSWNCGAEGNTADPEINALRERQAKNFLAILMLSRGVPMLLAGDEVLRTQRGNNNAYSQEQRSLVVRLARRRRAPRDAALHARADRVATEASQPHGQPILRRAARAGPRIAGRALARREARRTWLARSEGPTARVYAHGQRRRRGPARHFQHGGFGYRRAGARGSGAQMACSARQRAAIAARHRGASAAEAVSGAPLRRAPTQRGRSRSSSLT